MTPIERLQNYKIHDSMRGYFGYELYKKMMVNNDIWIITADLGYGMFDPHKEDFSDRFINVGAAEQTTMNIAIGLALSDKIIEYWPEDKVEMARVINEMTENLRPSFLSSKR